MSNKRLTVVQVLPSLDGGGVERTTLEVAAALARQGHRSIVISAGGRQVGQLVAQGSEHIAWPIGTKSPLTLRWVARLRTLLRNENADILHAHSRLPAWVGWLAWKTMNRHCRPRFLTTVHGLYSVNPYSAVMARGERVIAVSRTAQQYLCQHYRAPLLSERMRLIPGGADRDKFPYGHRPSEDWLNHWYHQYPQLKHCPVLTLPGRLTRLKGHRDFVELMSRLRQQGIRAAGLIVGGEDPRRQAYAHEIRQFVRQRKLDNVLFLGHRNDVREIFAQSNLVLSLSQRRESFGLTVLESLSLGVPVIGYDHGGVGEILHAMFPQGRVPPGRLDLLADVVSDFLVARPVVPQSPLFLLQEMLERTLSLYGELAAERGGGRETQQELTNLQEGIEQCGSRSCA